MTLLKRKERIKNIDIELENWRNLKTNSEKMISELNDRKNKIELEINEKSKKSGKNSNIKRSKFTKS